MGDNTLHEADLALQDRVRKDRKNCDHIGFYTPLGHDSFPLTTGNFIIVSSVLCMMCGQRFHSLSEIARPKPEDETKPSILS